MFQVISELTTTNFTGRVYCRDILPSQFVEAGSEKERQQLDTILCGMDWNVLVAELQSDKVYSAINAAVSILCALGMCCRKLTFWPIDVIGGNMIYTR